MNPKSIVSEQQLAEMAKIAEALPSKRLLKRLEIGDHWSPRLVLTAKSLWMMAVLAAFAGMADLSDQAWPVAIALAAFAALVQAPAFVFEVILRPDLAVDVGHLDHAERQMLDTLMRLCPGLDQQINEAHGLNSLRRVDVLALVAAAKPREFP